MLILIRDFEHWRTVARQLFRDDTLPSHVRLRDQREECDQRSLFSGELGNTPWSSSGSDDERPKAKRSFTVPREFVTLAENVGYHRDSRRWDLLYRTLWRLKREQPHLLELATDDDLYQLRTMEKQVRRDAHKMKAFVRFRKVVRDDIEYFISWYVPDHYVLRKVAPFFSRRFKAMNWTILTPDESVSWDQSKLQYGSGVERSAALDSDELEDLWKTYYAAIFNPARVKVKAMKNEMPVRFWPTMPETQLIPELLASAEIRVGRMLTNREGYVSTAADFISSCEAERRTPISSLKELSQLAERCTACDLHCHATQTVFGEGPATARWVIVGEQPGDVEDRVGRPFVGPAGKMLDEVLATAGIDRSEVYLTNVVKHFKHTLIDDVECESSAGMHPREMRGKRRLHKRPNAMEVRVCKPWLSAEWELLKNAAVLVCLGSTAAKALIGPQFRISEQRGRLVRSDLCDRTIATWHPSAVLRSTDAAVRAAKRAQMVADLALALENG